MALAMAWTAVSAQQFLIYPILESKLVVPDFVVPGEWPRAFAVVVNWSKIAVIWAALDPESDVLYFILKRPNQPHKWQPSAHVATGFQA
jgi:hypothetical protein